jgi:ribosomal protein S18 acetylase RimI-like enzyme
VSYPLTIEPLSAEHDRTSFESGVAALDRYIREQVGQDIRRYVTSCYVACRAGSKRVIGYYTTAMGAVPLGHFPIAISKRLPRYPSVPVARIGRLAVDLTCRGEGTGSALVLNALVRVHRSEIAAFALVVDAKDEKAVAFYLRMGFTKFESLPMSMFLPIAEFARRAGRT